MRPCVRPRVPAAAFVFYDFLVVKVTFQKITIVKTMTLATTLSKHLVKLIVLFANVDKLIVKW